MAGLFKKAKNAAADAVPTVDISDKFAEFAKSSNPKSDGKSIDLETTNKWMKQADVFNSKFTTKDTSNMFDKLK